MPLPDSEALTSECSGAIFSVDLDRPISTSLLSSAFRWRTKAIEFRAEFFNLFNYVNLANPNGNFSAIPSGSLDPNTWQVINPGSFGRITGVTNNPPLDPTCSEVQFLA
jgi:hypothetical protein